MIDRIVLISLYCGLMGLLPVSPTLGQNAMGNKPLRINLNEENTHWIKFFTYVQLWARITDNNPGSTVFGEIEESTTDISIRRFRLGLHGQLTDRLYTFFLLGKNNLNYLSPRGTSTDLLDAYAEYTLNPKLAIGGGKTAWAGLSRYAAPSGSRALAYDLSFVALPTVNETDDLIRKLSLYVKGKIGPIDYRFASSKPFPAQNSRGFDPFPEQNISKFADNTAQRAFSGYIKWEFRDRESNLTPFSTGTYLGKKNVMNLGAGFDTQSDALWHLENTDTLFTDMWLWSIDYFLDLPLNSQKGNALTIYMAYFDFNFGPNYVRNIGANNPANGVDPNLASFNGRGNSYPLVGTGSTVFLQSGYLFPALNSGGKIQPYFSFQYSDFERLEDPMVYFDIGINWFTHGHLSKFTLNYQNRPIFFQTPIGLQTEERRYMLVLQYQIRIE